MEKKEIVYLIRQFYRIQEHRIAFGGQVRALKEGGLETTPLEKWFNQLFEIEKGIGKDIGGTLKEEEIWKEFLKKTRGIGSILGAGLINLIDIERARHISSLWKYAGLDVVDGRGRSRKKEHLVEKEYVNEQGKKKKTKGISFNPLLKCLCWKIGKSFIMTKSSYREFYDKRKEYEEVKHPELTKGHRHNRAIRYMVKRFLADFWIAWRQIEGLPITMPYVVDKLGHKLDK